MGLLNSITQWIKISEISQLSQPAETPNKLKSTDD